MNVEITFRHIEPTDALKEYVQRRLQRVERYLNRTLVDAHAILGMDNRKSTPMHFAEIVLNVSRNTLRSRVSDPDLYRAVDGVVEKLEHQAKKYKAKLVGR